MPDHPPDDPTVTRLLEEAAAGEPGAESKLVEAVYGELREIARRHMAGERAGHTLQATALVHEAYLRLLGGLRGRRFHGREHFYRAAAEAMRRILIDHARRRGRVRRGGDRKRLAAANIVELAEFGDSEDILAVDGAIRRLEEIDSRMGRMVRLRFFAGLSVADTAEVLGVSERTVHRDWEFARTWLYRALRPEP